MGESQSADAEHMLSSIEQDEIFLNQVFRREFGYLKGKALMSVQKNSNGL